MSRYDPLQDLSSLPDVRLRWQRLHGRLGEYRHLTREIVLDPRLERRAQRCTLAHELQHAHRGDLPCVDAVLQKRQEMLVERAAARRLIPLTDLAEALCWARDRHEAAEALDVDRAMLECRLSSLTDAERDALAVALTRTGPEPAA
jgi:Zn-dependent peptidase ImmA (M78 family)